MKAILSGLVLFLAFAFSVGAADERWKFEYSAPPESLEELQTLGEIFASVKAQAETALQKYKEIPEVAELQKVFGENIYVSMLVATRNGVFSFSAGTDRAPMMGTFEITLFGKDAAYHPMIMGRPAFFFPDWQAVFLAGIEWEDSRWFDAVVLRELRHLLRAKSGHDLPSIMSDAWVAEQVAGHQIEYFVLNTSVEGKYQSELEKIEREFAHIDKLFDFLEGVGPEHLAQLDKLFNPAPIDGREYALRREQYYIDLALTWVEVNFPEVEWEGLYLNAYRAIVKLGREDRLD